MKNQSGFAMFVPMLLAIAATGGTIVAIEQVSDTEKPILSASITGRDLNSTASEPYVATSMTVAPATEAPEE
jgi:cytochrome c oxidase assembly factor CtaG